MEFTEHPHTDQEINLEIMMHTAYAIDCYMNNHIYSTLFKIQERKSDRRSREIEQRKESQNTHT